MSTSPPPAPPAPAPLMTTLPYMSGYEHFIQTMNPRIRINNPGLPEMDAFLKSAELWQKLAPCERLYWDKIALDSWDKYTRDIMRLVKEYPQNYAFYANVPTIVRCQYCNCTTDHYITTQDATAQGAETRGAMAQGTTTRGAMAESAKAQGAMAESDKAQGATAEGATAQGAFTQGATTRGYRGEDATILVYGARGVGAQVYGTRGVGAQAYTAPDDMEAGTSYKSYLYYGDNPKPEVRRFLLEELESFKFEPLQTKVRALYKLKSQKFSIAWKDEDGDEVVMSSDAEVKTMLSEGQDGVIKLVVRCENDARAQIFPEAKEEPPAVASTSTNQGELPTAIHKGVTCDGCGLAVVGHRYKCISCDSFDLCAKCETEGKHSQHCVVRVPHPNMAVPLLKATIKNSRRFLKSVTATAIEENKKLRRERRHSTEPNTQGKKDSQPRTCVSWMEAFNKYMDEFANIAGNMAYCPAKETATTEAATSTEPRSGGTDMNVPTGDQIDRNPWGLDVIDISKLQRAYKYIHENNLGETTKQAVKFFGALDPGHAFAPDMHLKKGASNRTQVEKDITEAGPAPREMPMKANLEPQETPKPNLGVGQPELAPTQAALSAKMAQITITGQDAPESKDINVKQVDISEVTNAVKMVDMPSNAVKMTDMPSNAVKMTDFSSDDVKMCETSSNASSCSEGSGYEKTEGWTVVNAENLKDENPDCLSLQMTDTEATANVDESPLEAQQPIRQQTPLYPPLNEPIRQQAPVYPPLNAATAVFNPKEGYVAPTSAAPASAFTAPTVAFAAHTTAPASTCAAPTTAPASASAAPTTAPMHQAAKKATSAAAAIAEDLRMQLAPHVEAALHQMEAMGFSNESGWLTQLLDHHDGNIAIVLDLIAPIKNSNAPSAPNAPNARPK